MHCLPALQFDWIHDLSLGTAALLVFATLAVFALLRGLLKMLWNTLGLCLAGFVAFWIWQHDLPPHSLPWIAPVAGFVVTLLLLRFAVRGLLPAPSDSESSGTGGKSGLSRLFTLLFSLIPTSAVCFLGALLLRHAGSLAEIQSFAQPDRTSDSAAFFSQLKQRIDELLPADWFHSVDPLTTQLRLDLAKLIVTADDPPPKAIPVLETGDIRELILADPELRQLAREGRYAEILRDPRLDRLLENDNLREVLRNTDL
ncbi:putative membrane protein required for colicin V production [Haloferula luteola]|uniref:Putative membrane protein required for colicin V production n=1 Tax=Haloferula luteola TaxID=595692 RepID=A0A840UY73_9BACT|nr:hypothetical protein [Haloferula luteola]MBB5350685.1 putative membrane protein required for colicin V production [Haloferula luteola]